MKWKLLVQFPESPRSEREGEDIHFYYSNCQTVAKVHQYLQIVDQDLGLRYREVGSIENEVAVAVVAGAVVEVWADPEVEANRRYPNDSVEVEVDPLKDLLRPEDIDGVIISDVEAVKSRWIIKLNVK